MFRRDDQQPYHASPVWAVLMAPIVRRREARRLRRAERLVEMGTDVVLEHFEQSRRAGYPIPMNPEEVDDLVFDVLVAVGTLKKPPT